MGLGEFAFVFTARIGARFTKKVSKKLIFGIPTKVFRTLLGDSGVEGELESLLRNKTFVLARMIKVTYGIANHRCNGVDAPRDVQESLDSLLALGCEKMSAKELFLGPIGDGPQMAEDDVNDVIELLEARQCLVTVWRMRVARQTKYVVAARGTRLTSLEDLEEDLHIAFEQLHDRRRVANLHRLVCMLIESYGHESVILTGHSLGAAVTSQVGRQLYLEGSEVGGHFFEPPLMSLDKILTKFLAFWEVEFFLLKCAANILHLKSFLDCLSRKLTKLFARWLEFDVDAAHAEFDLLQGYHPYIYVQKYDDIANGHINFFKYSCTHSDGRGLSKFTAILNSLGFEAHARHLFPSAYLITGDKGLGTLTSHGITNWIDVEPIRVKGAKYTNLNHVRDI